MTGKAQFFGLVFLVCILLSGGCSSVGKTQSTKVSQADKVELTVADKEKAGLLKQIDRRFENPDAHYKLGRLYQADGLRARAEYHYNIAMSFDPAHRDAQVAMVRLLLDSGDTAKAELSAEIYMNQVSGSAQESLRLALGFQGQQLDEYAFACYQQALQLAPNSAKINRQIGYYYLSRNDKERAKDYLARSFQLNPNQPEVAGELGRLGVPVRIPRKVEKSTKKLDKIVEKSDREISQ